MLQNSMHYQTQDFMAKAKEFGLIDDLNEKVEEQKYQKRLALIKKISELPTAEEAGLPALQAQCLAARIAFEDAKEAYQQADKHYKDLSIRAYYINNNFECSRLSIERQIDELASSDLKAAWIDILNLQPVVDKQFAVFVETGRDFFPDVLPQRPYRMMQSFKNLELWQTMQKLVLES